MLKRDQPTRYTRDEDILTLSRRGVSSSPIFQTKSYFSSHNKIFSVTQIRRKLDLKFVCYIVSWCLK